MLSTLATILIILWLLGVVTSYTLGGFVHVLFIIALIMILIRLINGQKVL
ncbi:MAG: lmo0937 family membrane protein [Candidatus Pacebacteria bacterium]|nr:lmo0937 family membrane protein [Candidatus Paceibacterota bacterium]